MLWIQGDQWILLKINQSVVQAVFLYKKPFRVEKLAQNWFAPSVISQNLTKKTIARLAKILSVCDTGYDHNQCYEWSNFCINKQYLTIYM
jgi:hypothetical protein